MTWQDWSYLLACLVAGYTAGSIAPAMGIVDWVLDALNEKPGRKTWRFYAAFPTVVVIVPLAWVVIGVRNLRDWLTREERRAAKHAMRSIPAQELLADPRGLLNEVKEKRDDA